MSYNNYVDAESAIEAASDLKGAGVAVIKHTNPCGYATGKSLKTAMEHAWSGDPLSAFGSVIALTKSLDKQTAEFLKDKFVEVIIAPAFDEAARNVLKGKENLRLLETKDFSIEGKQYRFLSGGVLEQDTDSGYADRKDFRKQFPSPYDEEWIFEHSSF